MKKIFPYILIAAIFGLFIFFFHHESLTYKMSAGLVHDYLRSQDIEDPKGLIHDRIFVSDSDIYIATGYLYAKGTDPTLYNFQHPPLIKYLFGFSTLLTGNPFYVQIIFGFFIMSLTYFLGMRLFKNIVVSGLTTLFLLIDPVFGGMMNQALLDLGQAVFSLAYLIIVFFFPEQFILEGVVLGLSFASKFWSTTLILLALTIGYRIFLRKEKMDYIKVALSLGTAAVVFLLTYSASFVNMGGAFNIFSFEGKVFKFMLTHNSASALGGPTILFVTGFFAPWWQAGVLRAVDWSFLWPVGIILSIFMAIKTKASEVKFYFYLLPAVYLLLTSTQVPFTRYFILILPYVYLSLSNFLFSAYRKK